MSRLTVAQGAALAAVALAVVAVTGIGPHAPVLITTGSFTVV